MQQTLATPVPKTMAAPSSADSRAIAELKRLERENQELREILASLENKGA